jgi:hypothetical protein
MYLSRALTKALSLVLVLCFGLSVKGQIKDTSAILDWRRGQFPKEKDNEIYQIKANGFYRFLANHRYMPEPYVLDEASGVTTEKNTLFIGDDTQFPNFLVNVSGRPNKKVSWGFDVFAFDFMRGTIQPARSGQVPTENLPNVYNPLAGDRLGGDLNLNLGLNLYGSYLTSQGTFNVRMGGIHWFSLSDLTLGGFRGYNRFLLFERNPWDPIGKNISVRYAALYGSGGIYQDLRWGERAVQGTILEGLNLPNNWSFAALYGKTELAAGLGAIPNINYGGRLRKSYNSKDYVSFNTLNNTTWLDSLNTQAVGFNIHTLEWRHDFGPMVLHAEAGVGRYVNPTFKFDWGEAINVKVQSKKSLTGIPLEFHFYQISPNVVNNNAIFINSAVNTAELEQSTSNNNSVTQSPNLLIPIASSVLPLGQMANNRRGLNLNTDFQLGDVKFSAGYGVATEINPNGNLITFSNNVNLLTRSRFWRFIFDPQAPPPVNRGPYERYDLGFRNVFTKVVATDDQQGISVNPKRFNQAEIHAKYKTKLFYRNFYANFLGRYYVVQPDLNVLPNLTNEAYLRQYTSELEMFYQITEPVFLNAYAGYERVLGGNNIQVNSETLLPLNQTGWGVGLGLDVSLGRNAGLYLRHRWFSFEDTSFTRDQFTGQETTAELTVYF